MQVNKHLFFHANVTNTHSPFDKSRTTSFVEELACYHNLMAKYLCWQTF